MREGKILMTHKQLKKTAKQIAEYEHKISKTEDSYEKSNYEKEIIRLTQTVTDFSDLVDLDSLIQEYLHDLQK